MTPFTPHRRMKTLLLLSALGWILAVATPVRAAANGPQLPPHTKARLANGLTLLLMEQHEVPLVSLHAVIKAGSLADPDGREGLALLTAQLLRRGTATRNAVGIAVAVILLAFLSMITRRKAMSQVVGFLSMENGLFFAATSATYGMPMVVELGIALDVLVGILILGVFLFHIREQFDSLDISHLEKLKED